MHITPKYSSFFLFICYLSSIASCQLFEPQKAPPPPKIYTNQYIPLSQLLDSLQISSKNLSIYISKKDHELHILADSIALKSYPVVLGFNPSDDKRREGDGCTPEGIFGVRDYYPHKKWSKFIWIDYPTQDSWVKHRLAKEKGTIPDTATIGGEIGIHGVPTGADHWIDEGQNWTWGCISLKNKDINEFYPYIKRGMKIEIEGVK